MNIKIFVAGAQSLKEQKNCFRIAANEQSVYYAMKNIDLSFLVWTAKDFELWLSDKGHQLEYDDFISDTADIFVCLFKDFAGGPATINELRVAYNAFIKGRHPFIKIFVEKGPNVDTVIADLSDIMAEISGNDAEGTYFDVYRDKEHLMELFKSSLDNYVIDYLPPTVIRPNLLEMRGLISIGQRMIDNKEYDKAYETLKKALKTFVVDWKIYANIAQICSTVRSDYKLSELAVSAYDMAIDKILDSDVGNKTRLYILRGGLKKRLGAMSMERRVEIYTSALMDLNEVRSRLSMLKSREVNDYYYNLIGVYALLNKTEECEIAAYEYRLVAQSEDDFENCLKRIIKTYHPPVNLSRLLPLD